MSASAYYQRASGAALGAGRRGRAAARRASASCTRPTTTPTATGACGRRCGAPASTVGRDRVKRLMRAHGIQGAKRRGKPWRTTIARPDGAPPPRSRPARLHRRRGPTSCGSPTSPTCAAGRAWCSSRSSSTPTRRRVVGWQLAGHMRTDLVLDALRMALGTPRGPAPTSQLVHHSDRRQPIHQLSTSPRPSTTTACSRSIGSVGDAYDNALAESFVDSFKTELIADRVWRTRIAARARDRRVRRLVQPRPPARSARRPPAGRVRSPRAAGSGRPTGS